MRLFSVAPACLMTSLIGIGFAQDRTMFRRFAERAI